MAEIPVVQEDQIPLWAALLGLLALAMVIWILFSLAPDAQPAAATAMVDSDTAIVADDSDLEVRTTVED